MNENVGNKENILLTIDAMKKFCMRASTPKSNEFYDYYIKLENIYFEYIICKLSNNKNIIKEKDNKLIELKSSPEIETIKYKSNNLLQENKNNPGAYLVILDPRINKKEITGIAYNIGGKQKEITSLEEFSLVNKEQYFVTEFGLYEILLY